jgi:hypothetical protein
VKEEEGSLIPSLEGLEASVEEDKTVGAECGDALAEEYDERSISVSISSYPNSLHRCFQPGLGAYLEESWVLGLWSPLQQKEHT